VAPACANHRLNLQRRRLEQAVRFGLEMAKAFGQRMCRFHDGEEWAKIQTRYGSMKRLQTLGEG
jgi:hypothetical protein